MSDKRSVFTDALDTLGTIITENEKRDAIHLAVEPVVAGQYLKPGADVGLKDDGRAYDLGPDKNIGIVDPFLKAHVNEGERFWLIIYPRQITSLRHVWTHPAIERVEGIVAESKMWLMAFLKGQSSYADENDYDTMIAFAKDGSDDELLNMGGLLEGMTGAIPTEFWHHIQVVTGSIIKKERQAQYFRCAC